MGRHSRKFRTRLGALAIGAAVSAVVYRHCVLLRYWAAPPPLPSSSSASSFGLSPMSSTSAEPFDVLVVGGGPVGLYAAVDAAQRGLRTALVAAADFDAGALPTVEPGAFPYVQRAVRQREWVWLRRAWAGLEAAARWQNVAPDACAASSAFPASNPPEDALSGWRRAHTVVWTFLPALHAAEMLELAVIAVGSTILSMLCGGSTHYNTLARPSTVAAALPGLAEKACGGVWVQDLYLDHTRAVQQLANTAEALGVSMLSYAPLCAIEYNSAGDDSSPACTTPLIKVTVSRSVAPVVAEGTKKCGPTTGGVSPVSTIYAKGLINCAGAWTDCVKDLTPCNTLDAVPQVFDFFSVHSYLVAPRSAVYAIPSPALEAPQRGLSEGDNSNDRDRQRDRPPLSWYSALCEKWNRRYSDTGGVERMLPAFQACSTLYSFSTSMVLPWYDRTVLLGPSISRLEQLPNNLSPSPTAPSEAVLHSADNYRHQIEHITNALAATGIGLDVSSVLSCVSHIVPVLKNTTAVPWASDLVYKGYHISTPQKLLQALEGGAETEAKSNTHPQALRPPFVHVYGGSTLMSRQIAEEALNALLNDTCAITDQRKKSLKSCGTKNLQLLCSSSTPELYPHKQIQVDAELLSSLCRPGTKESVASADNVLAPLMWVKKLARSGYVQHLSDLVLRRTHVGYTSPAEAVQVLPYLADLLSKYLGWDSKREKAEVAAAKALIESVAVRANPKNASCSPR